MRARDFWSTRRLEWDWFSWHVTRESCPTCSVFYKFLKILLNGLTCFRCRRVSRFSFLFVGKRDFVWGESSFYLSFSHFIINNTQCLQERKTLEKSSFLTLKDLEQNHELPVWHLPPTDPSNRESKLTKPIQTDGPGMDLPPNRL
jgi:hypothetical protein